MAFVAVQVVGEVFRMKFGESRIVNSNLFDNAEEIESVEGAFILQREILEIHALLAAQLSPWSSHDETYTAVFSRVGLDRISSRYGVQLCDTLIVEGELYQFRSLKLCSFHRVRKKHSLRNSTHGHSHCDQRCLSEHGVRLYMSSHGLFRFSFFL